MIDTTHTQKSNFIFTVVYYLPPLHITFYAKNKCIFIQFWTLQVKLFDFKANWARYSSLRRPLPENTLIIWPIHCGWKWLFRGNSVMYHLNGKINFQWCELRCFQNYREFMGGTLKLANSGICNFYMSARRVIVYKMLRYFWSV